MALNPETTKKEALKAGVTLVAGLALLGVFIVFLGGHRFWEDLTPYTIRFQSVKDLTPGRPVKYAGLSIGRVLKIHVDEENPALIDVTIGVEKDFSLFQGTQARITQKGLVGDNYVLLELRQQPGPKLEKGATIPPVESISLTDLTQKVGDLLDEIKPKITEVADSLANMLSKENSENISRTLQRMPEIADRLDSLLAQAGGTLETVETDWHSLIQSAESGIDTTADSVKQASDSLMKTFEIANTTLVDLQSTISKIGTLTENLDAVVEYDQEKVAMLLDNLNRLAKDLQLLTRSLRERPWQLIYKPDEEARK